MGIVNRKCIILSQHALDEANNTCRLNIRRKKRSACLGRRTFLYKNAKIVLQDGPWPLSSSSNRYWLTMENVQVLGRVSYRSDRMNHARSNIMLLVHIRGSLKRTRFHVGGLIEASSRSLMCAACTRSDWAISRVTGEG